MPSHLTRVVFRSILANKPLLYRGCLYRASRPHISLQYGFRTVPQSPRRTFFSFFKSHQRRTKEADFPPGKVELKEFCLSKDSNERLPPASDVAIAFNTFMSHMLQKDKQFAEEDLYIGASSFEYLQHNLREDGRPWLSTDDIRKALVALQKPPKVRTEWHHNFGLILYEEFIKRRQASASKDSLSAKAMDSENYKKPEPALYIKILTLNGFSRDAQKWAQKRFPGPIDSKTPPAHARLMAKVWTDVLTGFCNEDNQEELVRTVDVMRELSVPFVPTMQSALVTYFARKKDLEQTKFWYSQPIVRLENLEEAAPSASTHTAVLRLCALSGDLTYGQQVVASLLKRTPNKEAWDTVFLWSAAIGKGADEVDRMMNVMVRRNDEARKAKPSLPVLRPDIDTINNLVEFSMSKQDPYSAERYITLGEKRDILPNARTFTLQIQYRLSVKDIDGARAAYFGLQGETNKDERSVEAINQLIRAMCDSHQHNFDDIMAIVDDLHEKKEQFEPATVAALCVLHLRRGEGLDAANVIQVRAHHFSPEQRVIIRDRLVEVLLDRQVSTADAWDTYQIIRQGLFETPREVRLVIMNEFFGRKRPDMACHVFFHMRNHTTPTVTATRDVYVAAFTGFARNADEESLELAHNQLKLDMNVEPDTKIRNALMLAYAATGKNLKALELWSEIASSEEGPTYNSIAIAFRSCEGMPYGDEYAKPIWRRLKEMDLDIDKTVFTAYIGALARSRLYDEVVKMLETVEDDYGFAPDLYVLGNWFNATANSETQDKIEAWIRKHYPVVWDELEALGHWVTFDGFGYRQYYINRDLDP
ncbi:hypothetical protein CC78DRAFT_487452 [Lojkania enalia]|uniref:Complex I intermediate-associated protein 84, mitochondrial n=1 Tax=Lojkania enalia TaxID=147567 RepID=A0A9P4N9M1_9PLEO|nr:hypothetical protein CC78DRAFT_487452 [Didymosphaeria enalia]